MDGRVRAEADARDREELKELSRLHQGEQMPFGIGEGGRYPLREDEVERDPDQPGLCRKAQRMSIEKRCEVYVNDLNDIPEEMDLKLEGTCSLLRPGLCFLRDKLFYKEAKQLGDKLKSYTKKEMEGRVFTLLRVFDGAL